MTDLAIGRVSPFGHPGITAHVQLPQAYRSLSRPSSPLDAKASTVCLIAFDLKFVRVAWLDANPSRTTGVDSSHPVESTQRSVLHHTIHPSVVKEQIGPLEGRHTESDASEKRRVRATSEDFHAQPEVGPTRRSRKEVIQPQVPLRLPCYDFAPVTELTFDGCPPCGLAHRLQVPPASMA